MTNGDYIRKALTDEVMAKDQSTIGHSLLRDDPYYPNSCTGYPFSKDDLCDILSSKTLIEWIKAERKDDPVEEE